MTEKLSDEMQADLRELFPLADADGSGVLSTKELDGCARARRATRPRARATPRLTRLGARDSR